MDLNEAFGWNDKFIWTMTESEIYRKLWELRKRKIQKAVSDYRAYGENGKAAIYKLKPYDPVRLEYFRQTELEEKENEAFDASMIKRISETLTKYDEKERVH